MKEIVIFNGIQKKKKKQFFSFNFLSNLKINN